MQKRKMETEMKVLHRQTSQFKKNKVKYDSKTETRDEDKKVVFLPPSFETFPVYTEIQVTGPALPELVNRAPVDVIIYHSPCSDGICSAWLLKRYNPDALELPMAYGVSLPKDDLLKDKAIYIVDFSFPATELLHISDIAKSVVVMDHHKTAVEALKEISHPKLTLILDAENKRCGAQIVFDYLFKNLTCNLASGGLCPIQFELAQTSNSTQDVRFWLVDMVADRDLWTWKLCWSKAVEACTLFKGFHESTSKFEELYQLVKNDKTCFNTFYETGLTLLEVDRKTIDSHVQNPVFCTFTDKSQRVYKVAIAFVPVHLRSEVGNLLCKTYKIDFAVCASYWMPQDEWRLSLRSIPETGVDVSEIAKCFPSGGGHKNASGATIYGSRSPSNKGLLNQDLFTYFTVSEVSFGANQGGVNPSEKKKT